AVSYGADAVGGIIHIKTKAYEGLWKDEKSEFTGSVALGENNLKTTDVGFNQQKQKIGYSVSMKTTQSDGEQHVNPNFVNASLGDSLFNNYFDLKTYSAALTFRNKRFKVYARAGADKRDFAAKYFYTASNYDESTEIVNSYWTQASVCYNNEISKTELNFSYRNNSDSFVFNPLFAPNSHTTERYNGTLSQNRKIGKTTLMYGIQSDFQSIVSTDRGDHTLASTGVFVLAQKSFKEMNFNGGLRLEQSKKIGLQIVPQINLSIPYKRYVFRSSMGRSIRQADFTERFVSYNIPSLSAGRNVGNPDLVAESAYSFDFGIDAYQNDKFIWTNTLFFRGSSNLIDYTITQSSEITNLTNLLDSASYLYATNVSEALTFGNEFGLKYKTELPSLSINWLLNYTFINTSTSDSTVSKYIANHPIHNLNLGATFKYHQLTWNISGTFINRDSEIVKNINAKIKNQYSRFNTKLSYTSKAMPISIYLDIRNIFNSKYQEILGAQMPGRWILAGLSWNIKHLKVKPIIY
ncbi:MAG: hypothetical protein KJP21_00250, partial [Bacteroidia bacterium]|nr:hypothetical protein [Bacteroidia bacterium]